MIGQIRALHVADQSLAPAEPNNTVVIEHHHPVGGQPGVALQARRAEPQGQREGIERVLTGMGAGAAVGEGDRPVEQ